MGKVIPFRKKKAAPKYWSPDVPQALGPTRLLVLVQVWQAGYNEGYRCDKSELRALKELQRYGYVEQNPTSPLHWRITNDGADRLLAPMRLLKEASK